MAASPKRSRRVASSSTACENCCIRSLLNLDEGGVAELRGWLIPLILLFISSLDVAVSAVVATQDPSASAPEPPLASGLGQENCASRTAPTPPTVARYDVRYKERRMLFASLQRQVWFNLVEACAQSTYDADIRGSMGRPRAVPPLYPGSTTSAQQQSSSSSTMARRAAYTMGKDDVDHSHQSGHYCIEGTPSIDQRKHYDHHACFGRFGRVSGLQHKMCSFLRAASSTSSASSDPSPICHLNCKHTAVFHSRR